MDPSSTFQAMFAATRAVHFSACLLLLGVWVFDRAVVRSHAQQLQDGPRAEWRRIARWMLLLAWPTALASAAVWFALVAMSMSELPLTQAVRWENVKIVASETSFGHAWQLHGVFLILAAPTAVLWQRLQQGRCQAVLAYANLALTAAITASIAWAGHGATGPAPSWHRAADVLHLLIAAAWPGGLLPLLLLLATPCPSPTAAADLASLVRRFSLLSLTSVTLLTATGVMNSWCLLGSFSALWTTGYGRLLLLKILLFLAMISLGAINLLVLKPRLIKASSLQPMTTQQAFRRLRWSVTMELSLAAMIFIVIGWLGLLPPPRM